MHCNSTDNVVCPDKLEDARIYSNNLDDVCDDAEDADGEYEEDLEDLDNVCSVQYFDILIFKPLKDSMSIWCIRVLNACWFLFFPISLEYVAPGHDLKSPGKLIKKHF